jgi:NitT/TauT family transport system permease protein
MHHPRALFEVRGRLPAQARLALGAGSFLLIMAVWSALTYSGKVPALYLPTPTALAQSAQRLIADGQLLKAVWASLERTLKALGITAVIAIPLGILMGSFPALDGLFAAPINAVKAVPATAFVGLVIMVFGIEERAKIMFLVLGSVFFLILMVRGAILNVREAYVRTAVDIGVTGPQMIWYVLIPGALPDIWEALILCNGIMWTYIVIAEYVNAQAGLGFLIRSAEKVYDSPQMYVSLITIGLVAVGTDTLLRWIARQLFPWKDKQV